MIILLLQYGRTPLDHALNGGHREVVNVLLSKGAKVSYVRYSSNATSH